MNYIAAVIDSIYPDPPKHVAECNDCPWRVEAKSRRKALRLAAGHVLAHHHTTVKVSAVAVDFVMAVPDLPKYAASRVEPLPALDEHEAEV